MNEKSKSKNQLTPTQSDNLPEKSEPFPSPDFIKKVRTFAALTNNHLMKRNTIGDEILESAELMKIAHEIVKEMDENGH